MTILQLLQNRGDKILTEAYEALSRTHVQSYEALDAESTKQRLKKLYDLIVQSVKERNLVPMRTHARAVAVDRFESGFDLWEVQTAFNVLEEVIWLCILKELPPAQFAEALGLVSTVLGAGKDTLARTYVSLASKRKVPSLSVKYLFAGTDR